MEKGISYLLKLIVSMYFCQPLGSKNGRPILADFFNILN